MTNDKTKLVKEAKNDKASRCCWYAYQRRNGIRRNATKPTLITTMPFGTHTPWGPVTRYVRLEAQLAVNTCDCKLLLSPGE